MEYALTADHHRVHALDAEKGQEYYCPVCGNQVIPRQGEVNSWHFAHVTSCVDDWKYDMSEWHRNWQNRFPESTREVVIEYKGESHRADILTGGYVIEFQHSPITSTEFERRNLFYTKAGYKVIWVFDETEAYLHRTPLSRRIFCSLNEPILQRRFGFIALICRKAIRTSRRRNL